MLAGNDAQTLSGKPKRPLKHETLKPVGGPVAPDGPERFGLGNGAVLLNGRYGDGEKDPGSS